MNRPYVKFVESNLKGGVSAELGPKTLILGANASGKTSIVQAVELALSGRVSDLAGRESVALEAALLALAPGRAGELWAKAKLSDGGSAAWNTEGTSGKAKKGRRKVPESVDPETCFPLRAVRGALLGSPETARKFFLSYAAADAVGADVVRAVPASLHDLLKRAVQASGAHGAPADKLLMVIEYAKSRVREFHARAKVQSLSSALPCPSDSDVARVEADLDSALGQLRGAETALAAREAAVEARAKLNSALERIRDLEGLIEAGAVVVQESAAAVAQFSEDPARSERRRMALSLLEFSVSRGITDTCPLCGDETYDAGTLQGRIDQFRAKGESGRKAQAAREALAEAKADLTDAQNEREMLLGLVEDYQRAIANDPGEAASPAAALDLVQVLQAKLTSLKSARAVWEQVRAAEDSVVAATREAADWELLVKDCQRAVERLLDAGVTTFIARVQLGLPSGDAFELRLRDGDRAVLQVGLSRGGHLHTALSGAEWARVMGALAAACAPTQGVSVIIPEERAFDPATLTTVLEGFGNLDSQVLLCSPTAPREVPEGWTVVRAGEKHAMTAKEANFDLSPDVFP